MAELSPVLATWKILEHDILGNLVAEKNLNNLVVNTGREMLLRSLFMVGASSGVVAMGVGASTTTATVTDIALTYELTGNGARKPLTNVNSAALSTADIISETVVINSVTYYRKLVCQAVWQTTDGNNNNVFGEYGLYSSIGVPFIPAVPLTPSASVGVMFNHLIDPSPTLKTSSNSITSQVTIRF